MGIRDEERRQGLAAHLLTVAESQSETPSGSPTSSADSGTDSLGSSRTTTTSKSRNESDRAS